MSEPPGNVGPPSEVVRASPYPSPFERDVILADGLELHFRPIRPDDEARLELFHARLDPDSIYRRYLSYHPVLSGAELEHLTHLDYVERFAVVALDSEDLVAVGRYDRLPHASRAEVAFVVLDDYQSRGIGQALFDMLCDAAVDRGITEFLAETQADNSHMIALFHNAGFPVRTSRDGDIVSLVSAIAPTELSRERRAERRYRTVVDTTIEGDRR